MTDNGYDYQVLVIGSGPAGQRAAIQAAKLNQRLAVLERMTILGGVCILQATASMVYTARRTPRIKTSP